MTRLHHVVAIAAISAVPMVWAQTNLSQNGDFETPASSGLTCFQNTISGSWTSFGPGGNLGSCFVLSGYTGSGLTFPSSRSGAQLMLVNNQEFVGTKIAQNVSLVAGTSYQLTFSMSGVDGDTTVPSLSVALAGVGSQSFTAAAAASWADKTWTFVPTSSGFVILSFTALAGYVNLDAINLQTSVVPEANTTLLMAVGMLVLAGVALRRRRLEEH